jgi:perosamine synthetase
MSSGRPVTTSTRYLLRFGIRQLMNLGKATLGLPLVYPSFACTTLDEDDIDIARRWLADQMAWYGDSLVHEYEERFARWNGSKHAFAFMGGRVALSACIHALNLKPGDEVILPGYTCVVVPNAFHFAGVKTIYSDIELDTYGLDAALIEGKITARTKGILLHHLYGLVSRDYEAIVDIARKHNLCVIEDCAQSTGAFFRKHKVGRLGDAAIYSTEQSKIFTTIQGGVAVTNRDDVAEGLQRYRDGVPYPQSDRIDCLLHNVIISYHAYKHPQRWWKGDLVRYKYYHKTVVSTTPEEERGIRPGHYGCKMPSPIAAIGINQLEKVDRYNEQRRSTAGKWDRWCEAAGYVKPVVVQDSIPVFLRYPVLVEPDKKIDTLWARKELGVNPGVWFAGNCHPVSRPIIGCPNADRAVRQCVNFPTILA